MKRMGAAVGIGLLAGAMALAQTEVTSVNAVGFVRHEIGAGKLALLTLNFEPFANPTIASVVGDQLGTGSKAFVWDRVSKGYLTASKTRAGWTGVGATNVLLRGDAFWLVNGGASAATVAIMGEVPAANNNASTSTVAGVSQTDAVGYAFPVDVVWTNTTLAKAMVTGDKMFFWDMDGQTYQGFSKTRAGWNTPVDFSIPAGRAFWVTTSQNIDWAEVVPYNL